MSEAVARLRSDKECEAYRAGQSSGYMAALHKVLPYDEAQAAYGDLQQAWAAYCPNGRILFETVRRSENAAGRVLYSMRMQFTGLWNATMDDLAAEGYEVRPVAIHECPRPSGDCGGEE